ncbi:MAG: hypothetical protein WC650_03300 [Candidatus Doudnabacteria bacterium]
MFSTWDFGLILFLAIGAGYGFIFRKGQIVVLFVSSYISFVVVNEVGNKVVSCLNNALNIESYGIWASPALKIGLFLVVMVLLAIWAEYLAASSGKKGMVNLVMSGVYGFLLAAMLLSILSLFLNSELEIQILTFSRLSSYIIDYRMWWFLAPAVLMLVSGLILWRKEKD